jgi:multidrug efflux pump subunit AcrB
MALAVVVAVLASYLLSRTIIPTLVRYLLAHELAHHDTAEGLASASPHVFSRLEGVSDLLICYPCWASDRNRTTCMGRVPVACG